MQYITEFFNSFKNNFDDFCSEYLIKILICIGIILVFLALKFIITALTRKIIRKSVEKKSGNAERIKHLNKMILSPIRILVITAAFAICIPVLGLKDGALEIGWDIVVSLLLFALFNGLFGFCDYSRYLILRTYEKKGQKPYILAADYTSMISKVVVVIIGSLTILQQWSINVSSLLAGLSIGGVALALAAQDTAANLFGALTVMFERPFEIGDYVEVGGIAGTVEKMSMRSTQIRQLNQALVYVPNSKLSSENITNWKMLSNRRVEMTLGILYSTPPELMKEFIEGIKEILDRNETVKKDTISVAFTQFADSSLNIDVRYHIETSEFSVMNAEREKINFEVLTLASRLNVGFAFPSRSIYIESDK